MKNRLPVVWKTAAPALSLLLVVSSLVFGVLAPDLLRAGRTAHAAPAARRGPEPPANQPIDFVENSGQWDAPVKFAAHGGADAAAFERDAVRLRFGKERPTSLSLNFEGASPGATLAGEAKRVGRYNFFVGGDPARWRSNVATYGGVLYRGLYEGIDVRVREAEGRFEYDLLLAAGADLAKVLIRVDGTERLEVNADGSLLLHTEGGTLRQTPPRTWEELPDGTRRAVECRFRKIDARRYGFEASGRDAALPLVIDPGLEWATYLGGGQWEEVLDLAPAGDGSADVIAVGVTASPDFSARASLWTGFVARFDAAGGLVYKTFLGGSDRERIHGLAVNTAGEPVVVGESYSLDFPTTPGAYDTTHGIGADSRASADAFVTRLNAAGDQLIFSTYLGTNEIDWAYAVAVAPNGAVVVAGETTSDNFPTTQGAYDRTRSCCTPFGQGSFSIKDAFVARLSASGSALEYSTYLGGHGDEIPKSIVVDAAGFVTLTGLTFSSPSASAPRFPTTPGALAPNPVSGSTTADAFLARLKLDGNGSADLKYSTFIGGNDTDEGYAVALDPTNPNDVLVGGVTYSTVSTAKFQTTAGTLRPTSDSVDGFVMKFRFPAAGGGQLIWSTLFGGFLYEEVSDLAVDAAGAVVITGQTNSFDLPTTQGAYDRTVAISSGLLFFDAYVARLSPDGARLLYGTYLGGSFNDEHTRLALTGPDAAAVSGWTKSPDFPASPTAFDPVLNNDGVGGVSVPFDGFLARLTLLPDGDGDDTVSAPALLAPAPGASVGVNELVTFDWSDVSDPSGVDGYHIQINRRPDFVCCNDWIEVWSADSEHVDSMRFDGPYYWRVQTADRSGNLSEWSEVRAFNVGTPPPPAAASLQSPANGARLPPNTGITFAWGSAAGAASYELQIDDSSSFSAPLVVSIAGLAQTQSVHSFDRERTYWWRVRGRNANGVNGPWSAARSFEIRRGATPPPTPTPTPTPTPIPTPTPTPKPSPTPAPVTLSSLTLNPSSVTGGNSSQGTVTLSGPAPSGGTAVALSSGNTGVARVPASVTVAAGVTSASFTVTTSAVTASTAVTLSASSGGVTRTATLNVNPSQSADTVSVQLAQYDSGKRELRIEATSSNAGAVLRCYVTSTGALIGTLTNSGGRYRGEFAWPSNPQSITVRSSLGGSATRAVTTK